MSLRKRSDFENALSELQCILLAHRGINDDSATKLAWIDFDIMDYLQLKGDRTPSELCVIFNLSKSNASKHLKRLKQYRLVEFTRNTDDGRSFFVSISSEGRALMDGVYKGRNELATKAEGVLSEAEKRQFTMLATKIIEALDDPALHMI